MNDFHRLAQFITCCWRLGEAGSDRIPTSHGILDSAIQQVLAESTVPSWVVNGLTFVDSRIGLQCIELPSILEWAQRAQLTSAPNPSYETTEVQVSQRLAAKLLASLGVDEDTAKEVGNRLKKYTDESRAALVSSNHALLEDY